jgi:uncharacterized protein YfkK (UPF0435 family)
MAEVLKSSSGIPTERILQLKKQGLDNDQIIQSLQREGFKSSQIFDALQQAELKESIGGSVSLDTDFSTQNPIEPDLGDLPPPPGKQVQTPVLDVNKVEEIAEAIIEEKWNILIDSVSKIVDWKERVDNTIEELTEKVKEINSKLDHVNDGVREKIDEYSKDISDIKADVMAQNKVLKKALPDIVSRASDEAIVIPEIVESGEKVEDESQEEHEDNIFGGTSIDDIE